MVAEPAAAAVTGTFALNAPAATVTVSGTDAALALLELRLTAMPPAGAGADKLRARFWVAGTVSARLDGEKLIVEATPPAEYGVRIVMTSLGYPPTEFSPQIFCEDKPYGATPPEVSPWVYQHWALAACQLNPGSKGLGICPFGSAGVETEHVALVVPETFVS